MSPADIKDRETKLQQITEIYTQLDNLERGGGGVLAPHHEDAKTITELRTSTINFTREHVYNTYNAILF